MSAFEVFSNRLECGCNMPGCAVCSDRLFQKNFDLARERPPSEVLDASVVI